MAGIIGILRSSKIIGGAFSLAYREIFTSLGRDAEGAASGPRRTCGWSSIVTADPADGAPDLRLLLRRRGVQR